MDKLNPTQNILEIGCGIGRGLEIVVKKGTTYTGIDKNKKLFGLLHLHPAVKKLI